MLCTRAATVATFQRILYSGHGDNAKSLGLNEALHSRGIPWSGHKKRRTSKHRAEVS
jgi:hypothetical protein